MRLNNSVLLIFIFLALLSGCTPLNKTDDLKNKNWKTEHSDSPKVSLQIEQYKATIKRLYSTNPDSAIYFYLKVIDLYEQNHMPYNEFDAYIKISELYCFRLNDGANAVYYYGEALKTMNKNGGFEDSNPFFYIDMGNMFYMNKLYAQAHKSFEKAIEIATEKKDSFAISVGQNNIGIVFREEGNFEASKSFFRRSLAIREKITPLYEAQEYIYLAKVFTYQNIADSILYYRNLAIEALKRHSLIQSNPSIITNSAAKALAEGFNIYESELMAIAGQLKNEPRKALQYYQIALDKANFFGDTESSIIYLFKIAELQDKLSNYEEAVKYATKAYQLAKTFKSFEYSVSTSKLLNELYAKNHNLNKANFYLNEVVDYSDSINRLEATAKLQTAKILLVTNQVEDSVRYYQFQVKKHRQITKIQSFSITILIFLLFMASILIVYIQRKRKLLKLEHLKQMALFIKKMEQEEQDKKLRKGEEIKYFSNKFEEKLIGLMETQKVYLQKNITLADLADMLDTNVTYLSQYINNQLKTNFNDYINSQRIKEACRMFRDNASMKYSVDQIADMVGFSSRTTFYTTFKKFTGITPSFFQKHILNHEVSFPDENR